MDSKISVQDREFVIGDIHGKYDILESLLKKFKEYSDGPKAKLTFLGDVINRGPDSVGCLVMALQDYPEFIQTRLILGNHEVAFIRKILGIDDVKIKNDTNSLVKEIIYKNIKPIKLEDALINSIANRISGNRHRAIAMVDRFIESQTMAINGNVGFFHAGVDPNISIEDIKSWANPIKTILNLYDNPSSPVMIQKPFLQHGEPFKSGLTVIHGHTPEYGWHGKPDIKNHIIKGYRLGLDAGPHAIAAAEIAPGGYQIFWASKT